MQGRTASYYVQQLFATNRGTHVLPMSLDCDEDRIYACAVLDDEDGGAVVVKFVNA